MFKAGKGGKKAGSTKARDLAGEAGVLAAGWLQKRGEGNRSYKRRFCIVRPLVEFRYYKTDEDVEPIKSVDVSSYVAVPDDHNHKGRTGYAFKICPAGTDDSGRVFDLEAHATSEREKWLSAFKLAQRTIDSETHRVTKELQEKYEAREKAQMEEFQSQNDELAAHVRSLELELQAMRNKIKGLKQTVETHERDMTEAGAALQEMFKRLEGTDIGGGGAAAGAGAGAGAQEAGPAAGATDLHDILTQFRNSKMLQYSMFRAERKRQEGKQRSSYSLSTSTMSLAPRRNGSALGADTGTPTATSAAPSSSGTLASIPDSKAMADDGAAATNGNGAGHGHGTASASSPVAVAQTSLSPPPPPAQAAAVSTATLPAAQPSGLTNAPSPPASSSSTSATISQAAAVAAPAAATAAAEPLLSRAVPAASPTVQPPPTTATPTATATATATHIARAPLTAPAHAISQPLPTPPPTSAGRSPPRHHSANASPRSGRYPFNRRAPGLGDEWDSDDDSFFDGDSRHRAGTRAALAATKTDLQKLQEFYSTYAPHKVKEAEKVLAQFEGRVPALFQLLETKYKRAVHGGHVPSHHAVMFASLPGNGAEEATSAAIAAAAGDHSTVLGDSDDDATDPSVHLAELRPQDSTVAQQLLNDQPPRWVSDDAAPNCQICAKSFGLLRRRHHCRRCGRCVCSSCSPKQLQKRIAEYGYFAPVRHCTDCHAGL